MSKRKKFNLYSISFLSCFLLTLLVLFLPIFPTFVIGSTVDEVTELILTGYSYFFASSAFLVLMSIVPLSIILIAFIVQSIYVFKLDRFSKFQSIAFSIPFLFISIFCYFSSAYLGGGIFTAIFIYISIITNIEIYKQENLPSPTSEKNNEQPRD